MSRFYASISGGRSEATRQGHSYINGHIRAWDLGVSVDGRGMANEQGDALSADGFDITITGGSGYSGLSKYFATVVDTEKGKLVTMAEQFGGATFLIKPNGQVVRKRKVKEAV